MKILDFTTENNTTQVRVLIEPKIFKEASEKQLKVLLSEVKVPGFRKGKAPVEMAEKSVNKEEWLEKSLKKVSLIASNWLENQDDERVEEILGEPIGYEVIKFDPQEKTVEVKINYESLPIATLDDYTKIISHNPDVKIVKVTEERLADVVEKRLAENAMLISTDQPATNKDVVIFDFQGSLNNKILANAKAEKYELDLANSHFISGYAEELIGLKKGDKKTFTIKFPNNYHAEDLKGQNVVFDVEIHDVKVKEIPKLDEQYVSQFTNLKEKTVEGYKKYIHEQLIAENKDKREKALKNEVLIWLLNNKNNKISYLPENTIKKEFAGFYHDAVKMIDETYKNMGGYKKYLQLINVTDEQFRENVYFDTVNALVLYVMTHAIAKKENIKVEELDLEVAKIEIQNRTKKVINSFDEKTTLKRIALQKKVIDFLTNNVVYEEKFEEKKDEAQKTND
ncbi:Trigger factor [[Mycoplasma] cavipharyngis]|uniref:trigger factor n=1 Tax=[Mycoplasma] cavipharyngis TaxID=92757 RepID=UPI00370498D9